MGDVTKYCQEREAVSITLIESSDNRMVFSVTESLSDALFSHSLTISVKPPEDWKRVSAK